MLTPVRSGRFKRDVKRAEKRGKDMNKLKTVLSLLIEERPFRPATTIIRSRESGRVFATFILSRIGCCFAPSKATNYNLPEPGRIRICSTNDRARRAGSGEARNPPFWRGGGGGASRVFLS